MRATIATVASTLFVMTFPLTAAAHPLGEAALDMEPGEWRELPTDNMGPTMDTTNGGVTEYGEGGGWDPNSERFFVHGQGHEGGTGQFRVVQFDAESNRWDVLPQPAWYGGYPHQISHPYDHNTVDQETGIYYMRPFQFDTVYSYDPAAEQWGELPAIPDWGWYSNCCGGLVHFPEMGSLVLAASGAVVAFDLGAQSWSPLGNVSMGGYHNFAEYLPEVGAVILGGGPSDGGDAAARTIHRLDADGTMTELGPAPIALGSTAAVTTADPVTGTMVVLGNGGTLHAYDAATDAWGIESEEAPLPVFPTIAAPISNHGVIMFASWDTGEPGLVYLYKMSPFTPPPDDDTGGGSSSDGGDDDSSGGDDSAGSNGDDDSSPGSNGNDSNGADDSNGGGEDGTDGAGAEASGSADDDAAPSGCACRSGRSPAAPGLGFALIGLLGLCRRRAWRSERRPR